MGVNYFTDVEVSSLRMNPYVDKASNKAITYSYSEAFKHHFINERNNGKLPTEIFRDAGFDTTVLGGRRIRSFSIRVQKMNERAEGFTDLRTQNAGRPRTKNRTLEQEIVYLKHQLALQKQQIEALKKRIL